MTNIPKKLLLDEWKEGDKTYCKPPSNYSLKDKINEIIAYLEDREEASKYRVVSWSKNGETAPKTTVEWIGDWSTAKEEASKGEFGCGDKKAVVSQRVSPLSNPSEHEEDLAKLIEDLVNISDWRGNLSINDVFDYIQARYVSKEKIKRLTAEADYDDIYNGYCNKCGGEIAYIRGRVPHSDKRRMCTTCLVEQLEDLSENNQPAKVGLGD